MAVVKVTDVL